MAYVARVDRNNADGAAPGTLRPVRPTNAFSRNTDLRLPATQSQASGARMDYLVVDPVRSYGGPRVRVVSCSSNAGVQAV
jgi:hypothetical protein